MAGAAAERLLRETRRHPDQPSRQDRPVRPDYRLQFELTSHLIEAVSSGIGVGLVPSFLVRDELQSGAVQLAIDRPLKTGLGYFLLLPSHPAPLPQLVAFKDWILSMAMEGESADSVEANAQMAGEDANAKAEAVPVRRFLPGICAIPAAFYQRGHAFATFMV